VFAELGRRSFLSLILGATAGPCVPAAASSGRPRIGAIRWDAWYDATSQPGRAVAAALSPRQYHFRVPFFGRILSDDTVTIDGGRQDVMDLEIELASFAGLDFWAFDAYARDSAMSKGLKLFLSSSVNSKIDFCILCGLGLWGTKDNPSSVLNWHTELMSKANYQTVLDNRPLYFLGFLSDSLIAERWGGLSQIRNTVGTLGARVKSLGRQEPYIVILDDDARRAHQLHSRNSRSPRQESWATRAVHRYFGRRR
jgi:hypothetical protein